MTGNYTGQIETYSADRVEGQDQITLGSQLSELMRVAGWVDSLAERYGITENVVFAMNLCLEESLSNVIRHGYRNQDGLRVTVRFSAPRIGYFLLTVDDDAPQFNPLELPPLPTIDQDPTVVGGQGIRLMRGFADSIEYSATETGNQLRIGFANPGSTPAAK